MSVLILLAAPVVAQDYIDLDDKMIPLTGHSSTQIAEYFPVTFHILPEFDCTPGRLNPFEIRIAQPFGVMPDDDVRLIVSKSGLALDWDADCDFDVYGKELHPLDITVKFSDGKQFSFRHVAKHVNLLTHDKVTAGLASLR